MMLKYNLFLNPLQYCYIAQLKHISYEIIFISACNVYNS